MATGMTIDAARSLLAQQTPFGGTGFALLGAIARLAAQPEDEDSARDLLIRTLERRDVLDESYRPLLDSLTATLGLYPYIFTPQQLGSSDQVVYEYHRPEALQEEEFVFHAGQQEVFQRLMTGKNVALSAPTSFGKSVITDALVASQQWRHIVIVVPTLALIDETRRRLSRFSGLYKIVTVPSQELAERNILIMTQERILEVDPLPSIELFVIDEFYKLDSETDPERTALLNTAWDKLRRTGAQYYLTGPHITDLSESLPSELRESLIVTDFRTVAVDQQVAAEAEDVPSRLLSLCDELDGQTLIYCRSPQRVRDVSQWLLEGGVGVHSPQGELAADWIAENYDHEWIVARCLRHGIGLHHGRIPRALQHHTVRMFNSGSLRYLICTSTLIEGVNTSARNVIVLDHVLNRQPLDYFTFSNIRGRAGRMFRHFVGRVFLFGSEPPEEDRIVDIPISSQSRRASTATLLQIPEVELSDAARERIGRYYTQTVLGVDTLRANRGVDPDRQLEVARMLRNEPRRWSRRLSWSGVPSYEELEAVSELIVDHLVTHQQRGRVTSRSLAARLNVARRTRTSIPDMVDAQLRYSDWDRDIAVEEVLFFVRNWMGHVFPSLIMALQRIQEDVFDEIGLEAGNYSYYAQQVESLFLPPYFVVLEEYGLPTVVALKLQDLGLRGDSIDELLSRLRVVAANPLVGDVLDPFEQDVLDEVVAGLGPAGR